MKTLRKITTYTLIFLLLGCQQLTGSLFENVESNNNKALVSGLSKENIDSSVRPQDNFYLYVNGNWLKEAVIPDDKTSIGSFYKLRDEADNNVKKIIETFAKRQHLIAGSDEQKVGDLYSSFIDIETRNASGISPVQPIFNKINSLKSKQEIAQFMGQYQALGITNPFQFYISVDAKNSSQYAAHLWQGGLGLPDKDYYINPQQRFVNIRAGYLTHIENMFNLVGFSEGKLAAKTIMFIETELAKLHWTRVQSRDSEKRYNKFNVNELHHKLTEQFNWQTYLAALGIAKEKAIIINQPDYVKGFGKVFQQTSVNDWKTYFIFHTLSQFSPYLNTPLVNEDFAFFSTQLNGRKAQKPVWKNGVSVVNSTLGEVVGKAYVAKHFIPNAKLKMRQLVENLRDAYSESINELTWMSAATKAAAQIKLNAFTPKIGYPDKWKDYSTLVIKPNDIVGNIMRAGLYSHKQAIAKLGGPIKRWEWGMTPQTVNAYYNPTVNEIVFPAAILQPPFFNMNADDAVNYGGIGAVIGHEMGHGFDDQGSKYDAQGNLKNWWSQQDLTAFKKRTDNLVSQYNNYAVFDDLHVNGKLTLGENIGDLSGVTIAYKAYKASLAGKPAPIINGLTGDQRFFMGYAQIWRAKFVEKALRNRVATDPHSPSEFRAVGALSNVPEFYKAFNVKPGDKMYIAPEKRVKIW